jgi:riboflavin kinase/FMN adenylyltransferase
LEGGRDLYGQHLEFEFAGRLREEQRFEGLEALTRQIALDCEAARALLA